MLITNTGENRENMVKIKVSWETLHSHCLGVPCSFRFCFLALDVLKMLKYEHIDLLLKRILYYACLIILKL